MSDGKFGGHLQQCSRQNFFKKIFLVDIWPNWHPDPDVRVRSSKKVKLWDALKMPNKRKVIEMGKNKAIENKKLSIFV